MTTTHVLFEFIGGDDWEIDAELLDENDNPYNLTNAQVLWTLVNNNGQHVLDVADVAISITDAVNGLCKLMVAAAKTTTLPGGRYSDALRIVTGGVTSTLCLGMVQVISDPWKTIPGISTARLRIVA